MFLNFSRKIFIAVFIIFVIIGIAINVFIFISKIQQVSGLKETPIILNIPKGAGLNEITDELYSKGLIQSKNIFKIYTLLKGSAHRLQNGKYKFITAVSIPELVGILRAGPKDIPVIIYPGMTLKEIDDKLAKEEIIEAGSLIKYNANFSNESLSNVDDELKSRYAFLEGAISLEGFLLPDTYEFRYGSDIDLVIKKILNNFQNKAMIIIGADLTTDKFQFQPLFGVNYVFGKDADGGVDKKNNSVLKLIIIASYLEKEVPDSEDRKLVAGIIEKRLKVGMPIQIDATILYNKCFGRFIGCALLNKSDFKVDSPYNTYLRRGLTPTPISNPSLDAIKSVVEKKESAYWFYLSDPKTKKTIFSENFDKHNANRIKYLK